MGLCKPGCLGEAALAALLVALSHAIAEGFGVQNVSGLADQRAIKWIMGKLLHDVGLRGGRMLRDAAPATVANILLCARANNELVLRRVVRWDTWVSAAAIVHLGCPWHDMRFERPMPLSGVSSISAIQYRSCTMVAEWTDITSERKKAGCFSVQVENGYHIQGIADNFVIVQTEETQLSSISEELEGDDSKYIVFFVI